MIMNEKSVNRKQLSHFILVVLRYTQYAGKELWPIKCLAVCRVVSMTRTLYKHHAVSLFLLFDNILNNLFPRCNRAT